MFHVPCVADKSAGLSPFGPSQQAVSSVPASIPNAADALAHARTRLSGAAVSLEHILSAETDASRQCRIEQQAPFIIEELRAALDYMAGLIADDEIATASEATVPPMGRAAA